MGYVLSAPMPMALLLRFGSVDYAVRGALMTDRGERLNASVTGRVEKWNAFGIGTIEEMMIALRIGVDSISASAMNLKPIGR